MTANTASLAPAATGDVVITRVVDAPRELVFKAWTDPEDLAQWWGPDGFTNPVCEVDPRPEGAIRIHMRGADGTIYPMKGVYREIVAPRRLVFTSSALDKEGKALFEVLNTVTFTEHGGKTTVALQALVKNATPAAAPHLAGAQVGWTQTINRLAAYAAKYSKTGKP